MRHTEAILRFLDTLGRVSDAQFYLGLFHSLPRESFALLSVDPEVARDAIDALTLDLRYLSRLELFPTLVFGLLDPADATSLADAAAGALAERGVAATRLGRDAPASATGIREAVRAGVLPVLALSGECDLDARFDMVSELASALQTRKLIFVRTDGRLGRSREDRISIVNLTTDYEELRASGVVRPDQLALLTELRRILAIPALHRMLAAVTSPLNLLKELFTVKGGGTLIKRGGNIRRQDGWEGVDLDRLRQLLESSFRRRLRADFFARPVRRLYLEESYRGAAIVTDTLCGAYLTKFAVETLAQGEGLGRDLWQLVRADHPTLFWRARPDNRIVPFYLKSCDGMTRAGDWQVFWVGAPLERIEAMIRHALEQPSDFA